MTAAPPTVNVGPVPVLPAPGLRQRLEDWLKQPGTQTGLSLLAGGFMLALLHPFAAAEGIAAVIIAAGLPKILPDNTTDQIKVRDVGNAIAHAAVTRQLPDLVAAAELVAADLADHPAA